MDKVGIEDAFVSWLSVSVMLGHGFYSRCLATLMCQIVRKYPAGFLPDTFGKSMFVMVQSINGAILWANLLWLFSLSLVAFATDWLGSSGFAPGPVALYGIVLACCNLSFAFIQFTIIREQKRMNNCGESCSVLAVALGQRQKEKITFFSCLVGIMLSIFFPGAVVVSLLIYAGIIGLWFIPDKRIEKIL